MSLKHTSTHTPNKAKKDSIFIIEMMAGVEPAVNAIR
jgi:hypothetical protein